MKIGAVNLRRDAEARGEVAASTEELAALGEDVPTDEWVWDQQLEETTVSRDPLQQRERRRDRAAQALASGQRTVRLLWIALVVSLMAHLIIPVCLVSAMMRPEKVALMDGTESLIISPLVPLEESNEILETLSLWAAKSFLDRGPQGFDAPETLQRVFLPDAAKKAEADFNRLAGEFSKKNIHQKFEIGRIDLQRLDQGVIMSRVIGQVLTQAQIGDEQLNEPQPLTLNLKLVRNPYLGRNKRYPFAVAEYTFGQPEQLPIQKQQ
jgi:hypothetical protein